MSDDVFRLPMAAAELVPHREGMLLIQTLDTFAGDMATGHLTISDENLFIRKNGQLDPIVYVEFLAQLVAAHSGYEAKRNQASPRTGFLVGIKDFQIHNTVRAGDLLVLSIKKDYAFDQITYLTGEIKRQNELIGSGTLKLWEQPAKEPAIRPEASEGFKGNTVHDIKPEWKKTADTMVLNEQILKYVKDLNSDGADSTVQIFFNDDFLGFRGHFPGMPILPGVIMLKTGLLIGEMMHGRSLIPVKIKQAKFAKSVLPDELIDIKSVLKYDGGQIRLNTLIVKDAETCAKFSIDCRAE